jgi:Protein O-mannosyl-transferase TMEM260-like
MAPSMASPPVSTAPAPVLDAGPAQPDAGRDQTRRDRWVTASIAAAVLAVYLRSLLPGIGYSGDTAKWQTLSLVGGVPHATGYPLYVALVQAFHTLVPIGNAAWRINLLSALAAVAAVAVLYHLLRMLDLRWGVAAATALVFAFTPTFWTQAVIAEVYSLHLLFLVSILACLTRWRLGGSNRWLLAGIGLLALSFGHHLTTVLLLPSVLWLVWSDRHRAVTGRNALWAVLVAVLGASQYLYLLYTTEVGGYVESPVQDLADLWGLVTGGPFKQDMWAFTAGELVRDRIPLLWDFLRGEYRILLVLPAVGLVRGLGRWTSGRRDSAIAVALLGLASAVYGLDYDVPDVIVFFLPLFLALAVFLGIGLDGAVAWVGDRLPAPPRVAAAVIAGALIAMPLAAGLVGYRQASQRGAVSEEQRIERIVDGVGEDAVILTYDYDDSEYLWYFLIGHGLGPARHLELVHAATVAQVQEYYSSGSGQVASAVQRIVAGGGVDRPAVVTSSPAQADALRDAGLTVTGAAPGLWRVDPQGSSGQAANR